MKKSVDLEKEAIRTVVSLMAAAARTAPKTRGIDNIEVIVIDDAAGKTAITTKMRELAAKRNKPSMERDANSIPTLCEMVVIGVRSNPAGLDCGFCGYSTCKGLAATKGICAYNSIDLGIAITSAAEVANRFHVDNRIMYSIGKAALALGLFSKQVNQALGMPLSISGKNPFFDRK